MNCRKGILLITLLFFTVVTGLSGVADGELLYRGFGGNRVVSGSCHLITLDGDTVILDAGSFFGEDGREIPPITADVLKNVQALFITHAHTDHIGRLLELEKKGYSGPIYTSLPTRELLPVMLTMAARYGDLGEETFFYSRASLERNIKRGQETPVHHHLACSWLRRINPQNLEARITRRSLLQKEGLYLCSYCVEEEVSLVMERVVTVPLGEPFPMTEKITLTTYLTPHIPGSVMVHLEGRDSGHSLLYTGDLGSGLSPFLPPQEEVAWAHWVLLEGTYGVERVLPPPERQDLFLEKIGHYLEEGRRIIIPALVLDRTQQLLSALYRGREAGLIPRSSSIRILGSSAVSISEIYGEGFLDPVFSPYFSPSFLQDGPFPLDFYEPLGEIPQLDQGDLLITSPGMADAGYSKELIWHSLDEEEVVIFFVGYLDPETFGGQLITAVQKGEEELLVEDTYLPINASIYQVDCFASHATPHQIADILSSITNLQGLMLVHSAYSTAKELKDYYQEFFPQLHIHIPRGGQEYLLEVLPLEELSLF